MLFLLLLFYFLLSFSLRLFFISPCHLNLAVQDIIVNWSPRQSPPAEDNGVAQGYTTRRTAAQSIPCHTTSKTKWGFVFSDPAPHNRSP
jgi:hypothetical protein